ncbi:MAG TPA: hypothetical protein PKM25_12120, partial [Candidatus Ozemobacteraceae bacterium]|nr:hypothetical protein [Candidatus Ozemobacteraceae bacterium]
MIMSIAYRRRQDVSILLVLSMIFSLWIAIPQPASAGFFQTVGNALKWTVNTAGSLAGACMGGVLGMAVGGGPIGMVAGAVGGYIVAKKVMNWATSSFVNVATTLGAVGGGLLMAGMGMPMLAVGIIGGALIARVAASLISKITGKSTKLVNKENVTIQEERSKSIIERRFATGAVGEAPASIQTKAQAAVVQAPEKTSQEV